MAYITRARMKAIKKGNNKANKNKNVCGLAVASRLGVAHLVRYLHAMADIKRAISKRYSIRSVRSYVTGKTVGAARSDLKRLTQDREDIIAFLVYVDRHVLLIGPDGKTQVDTDPRQRDKRPIKRIYGIYAKPSYNYHQIIASFK